MATHVRLVSVEGGSSQLTTDPALKSHIESKTAFAMSSVRGTNNLTVMVADLNWAAPCLVSVHLQTVQLGMPAFILDGDGSTPCDTGFVAMPKFAHQQISYGGKQSAC